MPAKKRSTKRKPTHQNSTDIVKLILADHKPLKRLIKILKDTEINLPKRHAAWEEFAPLLVVHSKSEEQSLYSFMKDDSGLRTEALEGDVEHALADQLLEEVERTDDIDLWSARVKVLAELVEHHVEEEENDLLPDFKTQTEAIERSLIGERYLLFKDRLIKMGGVDAPHEEDLSESYAKF